MRYRTLGRTGLRVSDLFLGAMLFGGSEAGQNGRTPIDECRRILDRYADAGGNVVDTASAYGESEDVLGELLQGRRDRFVLATKYTLSRDGTDPNAAGNHRKNLTLSLEQSLRRLRTDYIDLYWAHVWDPHTPVEETMRALDDAVRAGKILYVGISHAPAWVVSRANTLAEWHGWTPFASIQVPYNLLNRDIERELLPMAEAYGMAVASWGPLAGGVLSGRLTRPGGPQSGSRFAADELGSREYATARAVQEVADEVGSTPARVALAWTRARSRAVHPIVGARTVEQLEDNLATLDVRLPDEALDRLEAATQFRLGEFSEFLAAAHSFAFGEVGAKVDAR